MVLTLADNEITLDSTSSSKSDNQGYVCFPYKIDFSRFSKIQVVYESVGSAATNFVTGQIYEDFAQFDTLYHQSQNVQAIALRETIRFKEAYDSTNSSSTVKDITYKGAGILVIGLYQHATKFKITNIHLFN